MPENVLTAEDIWQALGSKRGPELLRGLVDELAKLHQRCAELGRLIEQLQVQQNFSGQLFALEAEANFGPQLPSHLEIHATQLLEPQDGFHGLEYDNNGVAFRWTGPQRQFSFRVSIDRRIPLIVELEVMRVADELRQSDLSLLVDGSLLPVPLLRVGPGHLGRAVLPAAAQRGTTTLTFIVPRTLGPDPAAADQRELGVAFRKLTIRPTGFARDAAETAAHPAQADALPAGASFEPHLGDPAAMLGDRPDDVGGADHSAVPRTYSFTAAEIPNGHPGFYALEHDNNGAPFRWSGGQPSFSFVVSIDRRASIELELQLMAVIDLRRQSPLRLELDGAEYRCEITPEGDHLAGRLLLPLRAAAGPTRLTFTVPALLRPDGSDRRELGIAFRELHLRPAAAVAPAAEASVEPSHLDHVNDRPEPAATGAAVAREPARKVRAGGRRGARAG
jgi:hypothetical protein